MEKESISHLEKLNQSDVDLSSLWNDVLNSIKNYSEKIISDCFFSIRVKLMIKVLNQISRENRLSKYDEKIFEYFHHLMWYYYQTINLYNQNKDSITNPKIKQIMDGICTVLSSQLNQFEENQQHEYIYSDMVSTKNPVRIEKDEIISSAKNYVLKTVSDMLSEYTDTKGKLCYRYVVSELVQSTSHETYIDILENIYMAIIDSYIDRMYNLYFETTKGSIEKINNLQLRKAANFYYESIKQEKENLEIIVKVQINALEDELKKTQIEILEHQKIEHVLDTLLEAYQHLGKEIESLAKYFKESECASKEVELLNLQQFKEYMVDEGAKKYIQDLTPKQFPSDIQLLNNCIEESKNLFNFKLKIRIQQILDYRLVCIDRSGNINYEIEKFKTEKSYMIDEFLECFVSIKHFYDENSTVLNETQHSEIFKGIYETIDIKLESLDENKKLFLESIEQLYKNFKIGISKRIKDEIINDVFKIWYNIYENEFIDTVETLYKSINEDTRILNYEQNLKRQKQQQLNNIEKKYIQFLKEHLLFELTTYEEILNYSVSRLRADTESDVVKKFVEIMDVVSSRIENLLEKYNIYAIKPKPYDLFDGKEHEVLMAEKHEGFEKGQIVKLMNSGYKYNNAVIIRANVIAAK